MIEITKKANQVIHGLTSEQKKVLTDYCTVENPAYKNALRFSKWGYTSIPSELKYYSAIDGDLVLPIGVDVAKLLEKDDIIYNDLRVSKETSFPDFLLELRGDQKRAIDSYIDCQYNRYPQSIIQLPTGKGKSILALYLAWLLKQKTLILVHKDDLVVGWKKDIQLCFGDKITSGLIKAKKRDVGEQFTIATVQTMGKMGEEELAKYTSEFGLVVQDECLVADTMILKEDGGIEKIQNVKNYDKLIGGYVYDKFSRYSDIYTLEFKHGLLTGSPSHKTWCVLKYDENKEFILKPISEIDNDYLIPVLRKVPHEQKNDISVKEAKLMAFVQSRGYIMQQANTILFGKMKNGAEKTNYYYNILNKISKEYNVPINDYELKGTELISYSICNGDIKEFLLRNGLPCGKKSGREEVPSSIFYAPIESVREYIKVMWECSHSLNIAKNRELRFHTISLNLANGMLHLLKKFGIVGGLSRFNYKNKDYYVYRITIQRGFYNLFMEEIKPCFDDGFRNSEILDDENFKGKYFLSPVKKFVNENYEDLVYDFTVSEDEHSFFANGAYTHNCHHVGLNIFNVINKFNSKYKLGLSATPTRSDGLNFVFDLFFNGLCYKHGVVVDDNDISNVEVRSIISPCRFSPFLYKGEIFNFYDFDEDEIPKGSRLVENIPYQDRPKIPHLVTDNSAVRDEETANKICDKIVEHYNMGHSILALFTQKEHINIYSKILGEKVPREKILLFYGDNKEKNEVLLEKAEKKECLITLATYAKATEGTNVKAWEVLFLVSSLNNAKNVEQATGRIRRKKEGKLNPVIVYDVKYPYVYQLRSHSSTRRNTYLNLRYKITF